MRSFRWQAEPMQHRSAWRILATEPPCQNGQGLRERQANYAVAWASSTGLGKLAAIDRDVDDDHNDEIWPIEGVGCLRRRGIHVQSQEIARQGHWLLHGKADFC